MQRKTRSVKSKWLLVLSIPLLVLFATTALTFRALKQSEETEGRVRHAYFVKDRIQRVHDDLVDVETGVRGYLLTDDPEFLEPYWRGSSALALDLQYLQISVENEGSDLDILRLRVLSKRRLDILDRLLSGAEDHATDETSTLALLSRGRIVMDEIRTLLGQMTTQQQGRVESAQREAERTRSGAFTIAVGGAPLGVGLALVVVLVFNGRIARRLGRVHANVRRLELGQTMMDVEGDPDDEIGRLDRALVRSGTLALELQEELQRLATIDPLTELANRRGLMPLLEHQLGIARRHHDSVALLFVDLDGLKAVNDILGHRVGDEMISETAALLRDTFRSSDVPARIGGDEFCVMLTGESAILTDAAKLRLQASIDFANRLPGRIYSLSMSMGVAIFDPDRPSSPDDLIAEADRRMYEDKRSKRADGLMPSLLGEEQGLDQPSR